MRAGDERAQLDSIRGLCDRWQHGVAIEEGLVALTDAGELPDVVHGGEDVEPLVLEPADPVDRRGEEVPFGRSVGTVGRVVVAKVHAKSNADPTLALSPIYTGRCNYLPHRHTSPPPIDLIHVESLVDAVRCPIDNPSGPPHQSHTF